MEIHRAHTGPSVQANTHQPACGLFYYVLRMAWLLYSISHRPNDVIAWVTDQAVWKMLDDFPIYDRSEP